MIYTCVTMGYEDDLPHAKPGDGHNYVCFSDDPALKAPGWTVRPLQSPPHIRQPRLIARYHKIFAHELFREARWSAWIDGNVDSSVPLDAALDALDNSGSAIAAFAHPSGRDVGEEFNACWYYRRFLPRDKWRAFAQVSHFERERFPLNTPITENRLLIRDHHHPKLPEIMRLMWSMLNRYTSRDQLSLQYCLWKLSESALLLDGVDGISPDQLRLRTHARPPRTIARSIKYRLSNLSRQSPRLALLRKRIVIARKRFAAQVADAEGLTAAIGSGVPMTG